MTVIWVFAEFIDEDDGALHYYVYCPDAWKLEDKNRAKNHFKNLDLASRYRLEAGKHLSEIIDQKNAFTNVIRRFDPHATPQKIKDGFVDANLQTMINSAQFPNYWKKVMYQCLAESPAFFEI